MNATPPEVQVTLYLPDHEALALTQFAKRIGWVELRDNAASEWVRIQ